MTLTQDQIKKLHKAIEQAREPGGCRYVSDGAPCCVVAQLAALEGVSLETLERWNTTPDNWVSKGVRQFNTIALRDKDPDAVMLVDGYGIGLLTDLQLMWDEASAEDAAREHMRDRVAQELPSN